MKTLKICIIIFSIFITLTLPAKSLIAITGNFSIDMGILDYGFKSIRDQSSKSIDKITVPKIQSYINFLNHKNYQFTIGYSYDYILQSVTYGGFTLIRKNYKIGSGLSLGFYNNLPLNFIPGAYGLIEITPIPAIKLSVYGYSSIFLKRLFSLESVSTDFDQNVLDFALYYRTDYVTVGLKYNSRYLYKSVSSGYINNSYHDYQFDIKTDLKNSIINSDTVIGGSDSIYKTSSINNRLIQIYIDETVLILIKSLELNIGGRINILSFTLKDSKSTSPPKLPYFNFHAGINVKFGE